jgi:hypothetical protein
VSCCFKVGTRTHRHVSVSARLLPSVWYRVSSSQTVRLLCPAYWLTIRRGQWRFFSRFQYGYHASVSILVGSTACGARPWTARLTARNPTT